jgi:tetratricopeptide (TPR) repeat protein
MRADERRTLAEALEYCALAGVELGLAASGDALQALAIYEELGDVYPQARVQSILGLLACEQRRWPAALKHYAAAEHAFARSGMAPISDRSSAFLSRSLDARATLERELPTAAQLLQDVRAETLIELGIRP